MLAYIVRVPLKTPSDKMCPFNTNLNPFNTHLSSDVTTRAENSQVIGGTNGVLTCQVTSGDAPSTCTWWKDSLQVRNLLNKLVRNNINSQSYLENLPASKILSCHNSFTIYEYLTLFPSRCSLGSAVSPQTGTLTSARSPCPPSPQTMLPSTNVEPSSTEILSWLLEKSTLDY